MAYFNHSEVPLASFDNHPSTGPGASKTELYVVMSYMSFLCVMGTGGNALVLYVFSQKKDKLVSTLFIIVLAFVDFITCLAVIPYTIYMEYRYFYTQYDFVCKLYQFLITSNIPFSALIMVAIAIDRYLCICHPFMHIMNVRRAKVMIGGLGLFAITLGVVVALIFGIYQVVKPQNTDEATLNATTMAMYRQIQAIHNSSSSSTSPITSLLTEYANYSHVTTVSSYHMTKILLTGKCEPNELVWSPAFQWYYQKFFMSLYIVCLVIVIILYTLIYKSVLARRTKRQKQKSKSLSMVLSTQAVVIERNGETTPATEETLLTSVNGDSSRVETTVAAKNNGPVASSSKESGKRSTRKSVKRDRHRMANLKTAAMLFVVTVVFVVTFLPAFLMAMQLIPYSMTVFYMYFANNVANPVIYSFMNKNFRDDLRRLFCRER